MLRFALLAFVAAGLLATASTASADSFTFYGTDDGGVGSATMDVTIDGYVLTAVVNNTSPILQLDGVSQNNPAIVAFGFDLSPDDLGSYTWDLVAETSLGVPVTIGSDLGAGSWDMATTVNGTTLDYIADGAVDGGLYNPLLAPVMGDTEGSKSNYFTMATLTMTFSVAPTLDIWAGAKGKDGSPWIRMQRVGADGSLKLPGKTPPANPEPATMVLMGLGMVGLGIRARRRRAA